MAKTIQKCDTFSSIYKGKLKKIFPVFFNFIDHISFCFLGHFFSNPYNKKEQNKYKN